MASSSAPVFTARVASSALPSVARVQETASGDDVYVLCNPVTGRRAADDGAAIRERGNLVIGVVGLVIILGAAIWTACAASGGVLGAVVSFLVGGFVGAVVAGLVGVVIDRVAGVLAVDAGRLEPDDLVVRRSDDLARRLAEAAHAIGATASWAESTVDPGRRVTDIAWVAVGRAMRLGERVADVERARAHTGLAELATEATAVLDRDRAALLEIEDHLLEVLLVAEDLDTRKAAEQDRTAAEAARLSEEQQLRAALLRTTGAAGSPGFDDLVDRAVAAAAEAEVVAGLLADVERMLRDL